VPLNGKASFSIANTLRDLRSRNVIARLEGSDPDLRNQYVVYTAHWDHLGRDTTAAGDQIFNGALDNATGTAALLEIARAYTRLAGPPKRTILFLAVTAEEQGLAGAKYYAENPLYPLEKTLVNINMDGVNQWGRTRDLTVIGYGNSTMDEVLRSLVEPKGRTLIPDPESEKGYFYRSDHFEFAKKGVPALYVEAGLDFIGKPADFGRQKREGYTSTDYHKPSDEIKPDWDLSGAVDDLRLLFEVGYMVANGATWPEWKPGTEFKAIREAMLGGN
jgi:Zn-dependent M28 family amino/carboxypeptidase